MTTTTSVARFAPLSIRNITLPSHLVITVTDRDLLTAFNTFGFDGSLFFGTAFVQGKRLQFTTAMPLSRLLEDAGRGMRGVTQLRRSNQGDGVEAVLDKPNRPRVAGHGKALRQYLLDYACGGEKFILPAFALNFGDQNTMQEDWADAELIIYSTNVNDTSLSAWPALFKLPREIKLDITDGAHRASEASSILADRRVNDDYKETLLRNAVDVKIIFEPHRSDAHQDFADCAKARPITGSLISTFDVRNLRNKRAVELVKHVPFLSTFVDATAANVNLSKRSKAVWSMSAVRGFVGQVMRSVNTTDSDELTSAIATRMHGAEAFFEALIRHMPELQGLAHEQVTTADLRTAHGGDIALRGVGLALFARAFEYAKTNTLVFDEVARWLGRLDWHVLDCETGDLPSTDTDEGRATFASKVAEHANPLWSGMLVIGESRFRVSSTDTEVENAWTKIKATFPSERAAAA